MYLSVQEFLNENKTVWWKIPAYAGGKVAFDNAITEIQKTITVQTDNTKGITQDKAAKREMLIQIALAVSSAIQSYATVAKNKTLYQAMKFTKSMLDEMKDAELPVKTKLIEETGIKYLSSLADYNVTPEVLEALKKAIDDFVEYNSLPKIAKGNKGVYTQNLKKQFLEADDILHNVLEKLTVQFKITNPVFYYEFLNAMEIYDAGKGSKTIPVELKPEESKTIYRVINGSKFVNTGKTTLIYCGDHLPPCDMGDENTVIVKPGETVYINFKTSDQTIKNPKIHFISITNTDKIQNGRCTVKVTSKIPVKE
jgi:hypothetical protein